MKIAIILAISVIFASGIYAANAEEPIPTLNFEGGDYTVYKENQILEFEHCHLNEDYLK